MSDFSCAAAGATSCGWTAPEGSEDEVVAAVAAHLQEVHGVQHVTSTLARYAAAVARDGQVSLRASDDTR